MGGRGDGGVRAEADRRKCSSRGLWKTALRLRDPLWRQCKVKEEELFKPAVNMAASEL